MTETTDHIQVELGERSYAIHIGAGYLEQVGRLLKEALGDQKRILVVTDSRVGPLYLKQLESALTSAGHHVASHEIPEGEASKCVDQLAGIWTTAVEARLDRNSVIVALGGGVVGDLAGFAAASFLRGISFVQVPTSLLAMVDSSVGGKTGMNLPQGKNLVGAFHQPALVVADLNLLSTLSPQEFSSGMAEVIKYGMIHDSDLFAMLERETSEIKALQEAPLRHLVRRSCEIKADIVRQDEREGGVRAFLNFGHTLGHAIENVSGYGKFLHGEAIASGMVYAAKLSEKINGFSEEGTHRLVHLLETFSLPTGFTESTWEELFKVMTADKKAQNAIPRFVLVNELGNALLPVEVSEALLHSVYNEWTG